MADTNVVTNTVSTASQYRCCCCKYRVNWKLHHEDEEEATYLCKECGHARCENCGQWRDSCQRTFLTQRSDCPDNCADCRLYDPMDGEEVGDDEEDEQPSKSWDEDIDVYFHRKTETEKKASIPLNQLLEPGPMDDNIVTFAGISHGRRVALQIPPEIKKMIYELSLANYLRQKRTIRVIPKKSGSWTYRSFNPPNQIPLFIHGLGGEMKSQAKKYLQQAPKLGSTSTYPYFNYGVDLLFLDYPSCGTTNEALKAYRKAMSKAAKYLRVHNRDHPRKLVDKIKITYCNHLEISTVLDLFRKVPGLDNIILEAHEHWAHIDRMTAQSMVFQEDVDMHWAVRDNQLKGSWNSRRNWVNYDFDVKMYDSNEIEVDGSFRDPDVDGSDEEESDDEGSNDEGNDDDSDAQGRQSDHDTLDTSFEDAKAANPVVESESQGGTEGNQEEVANGIEEVVGDIESTCSGH